MPRATPVVFVALVCLASLTLLTLPSLTNGQSVTAHYPDRVIHGWWPWSVAISTSPSPRTANLLYMVDGYYGVVAVDARDGRVVRNASLADINYSLDAIAVDSRGYVFVTAAPPASQQWTGLLIFNSELTLLTNISFSSLMPPSDARAVQLAIDSNDTVWLFDGKPSPFSSTNTRGHVWALSPHQWQQQSSWQAPITLATTTSYVMAIDNNDSLCFQQVSATSRCTSQTEAECCSAHTSWARATCRNQRLLISPSTLSCGCGRSTATQRTFP